MYSVTRSLHAKVPSHKTFTSYSGNFRPYRGYIKFFWLTFLQNLVFTKTKFSLLRGKRKLKSSNKLTFLLKKLPKNQKCHAESRFLIIRKMRLWWKYVYRNPDVRQIANIWHILRIMRIPAKHNEWNGTLLDCWIRRNDFPCWHSWPQNSRKWHQWREIQMSSQGKVYSHSANGPHLVEFLKAT